MYHAPKVLLGTNPLNPGRAMETLIPLSPNTSFINYRIGSEHSEMCSRSSRRLLHVFTKFKYEREGLLTFLPPELSSQRVPHL